MRSTTLAFYITRSFLTGVGAMLAALTLLVALFDFLELLRRAATKPDATFALVAGIEALRLPYIAVRILPFAVLLGGILAFWRLTRSSELIVARASGLSAWQFLAAPVLTAALLGIIAAMGVTPVSSALFARAETLDDLYIRANAGPMALKGGKLWLRQADRELDPQGVAILHAEGVEVRKRSLAVTDVSIFRLAANDRLLERIEAPRAEMSQGAWHLTQARTSLPDRLPSPPADRLLPTDLTVARVQDSFASPDTLSLWVLPDFIALLDSAGFSSVRHQLHFQALLALPLLTATMALVAAGFSMRPARRGGVVKMLGGGVAAGFALFVVSQLAEEFGQSGAIPPPVAAWVPALAGLFLALALLMHLEDG